MVEIKKSKNYLKIIGIFIFIYILSKIDWHELSVVFGNVNIFYFLMAVLLIGPVILLKTLKWKLLVNSSGATVPLGKLTKMFIKSLSLGFITPAKLGEFYRAKYLTEASKAPLGNSLFTVVLDRLTGLITFVFIGMVGGILLFGLDKPAMVLIALFFLIIVLISYFLVKDRPQRAWRFCVNYFIPQALREKSNLFVENFFNQMKKVNSILLFKLFSFEFIYYIVLVLAHYFLSSSLGLGIPFWYLFVIISLVALIVILPISVSGLGTREVGYIFLLSFLKISMTQATSFSLLILVWNILLTLPGAILLLK